MRKMNSRDCSSERRIISKKPFSQKILLARVSNLLKNKETVRKPASVVPGSFSEMECRVAELIIKGYNGREISEKLFYSYSYVKKLLASMREKTDCDTLGDLKRWLSGER